MSDEQRPPAEPAEDPQRIATGMTLADISIRNHVFAWILMFALIGFGILCFTGFGTVFKGLGVSQNPDVDFPVVNISISWEGASPEIMETDVVDLVEDAVTSVEGVKEITSSSRQGTANVTVEFELERDIDVALQDVQSKLSQLQRHLPRDIDPPIVSKTNPEDEPIMRLAVGGSRPPTFVADYIRNVIRPQLQTIPGVGEIQLSGFRDRNVRVWYDAVRLEAQGLTVQHVNAAIQREHLEVPAGRHRDARARDERARRGRGDRRRGLPQAGDHLQERRPGAAARRGGGRGRARGPAAAVPHHGRARDRLRHHQAARRQRGAGRPRRARPAARGREAAARGPVPGGQLRHHRLRGAGDQRDPVHAGAGGAADEPRVLAVPGLVVDDAQRAAGDTHLDPRHLHRHVRLRLHAEHLHRARPHAGGRDRGRRRDHGAREHLPPPRARGGQGDGRLGRRARDHLRGGGGDARDHGDLPAGRLHEGHHRQVLLPVRRHDHGGGADLAARGAHARADAPVAHARGRRALEPARAVGEPRLRPGRGRLRAAAGAGAAPPRPRAGLVPRCCSCSRSAS